jgi:excisionase family DNA binding protein
MDAPTGEAKLTYTVEEAGQLLGVGRNTAYEAAAKGEIPTVRIGRRILVPRAALLAMLAEPSTRPAAN